MKKILQVIQPFFTAEVGDTFTYSNEDKLYVSQTGQEFHKGGDDGELTSVFDSTFKISPTYAQELIKEGFLEEMGEKTDSKPFVNIFDEIKNLQTKYATELTTIDEDCKDMPQCMKVEKETVLRNILGVLNHLSLLKK